MRAVLFVLSFVSLSLAALPAGVKELALRLSQRPAFECDFVQERSLQGMRVPLRSSGVFRLEPGQKASWLQKKPVDQKILLTSGGMELVRADGSTQKLSSSAPVAGEIARALFSLTQGDFEGLGKTFDVEWVKKGETNWAIKLLPRGVAAKAFKDIVLGGGADLRTILLTDAQGLPTKIEFAAPRPLSKP